LRIGLGTGALFVSLVEVFLALIVLVVHVQSCCVCRVVIRSWMRPKPRPGFGKYGI
jgi:hypothetical protein